MPRAAAAGFELDTRDLVRLINDVGRAAPTVAARAVNKSAASAKVALVREVAKDMSVTQKSIRDKVELERADPGPRPEAKLRAATKRVPLIKFKATQLKRAGVKANTGRGRKTYPGAFIATMRSGHTGVFRRVKRGGKRVGRLPIAELHGPSIGLVFSKRWNSAVDRFREQLPKNVVRELRFAARRAA